MCRSALKSLLLSIVLLTLMATCACGTEQETQGAALDIPEATEEKMDPSIERDVQMITDALLLSEYEKPNVIKGVETLRAYGVGSFVSLRILDEEELNDYERAGKFYCVAVITDELGVTYRVGFIENGLVDAVYPPEGLGTFFIYSREFT